MAVPSGSSVCQVDRLLWRVFFLYSSSLVFLSVGCLTGSFFIRRSYIRLRRSSHVILACLYYEFGVDPGPDDLFRVVLSIGCDDSIYSFACYGRGIPTAKPQNTSHKRISCHVVTRAFCSLTSLPPCCYAASSSYGGPHRQPCQSRQATAAIPERPSSPPPTRPSTASTPPTLIFVALSPTTASYCRHDQHCALLDGNKLYVHKIVGTISAKCYSKWLFPHKHDSGLISHHMNLPMSLPSSSGNVYKTRKGCLVSPTQPWWFSVNTIY